MLPSINPSNSFWRRIQLRDVRSAEMNLREAKGKLRKTKQNRRTGAE